MEIDIDIDSFNYSIFHDDNNIGLIPIVEYCRYLMLKKVRVKNKKEIDFIV